MILICVCVGGYTRYLTRTLTDIYGITKETLFQVYTILVFLLCKILIIGFKHCSLDSLCRFGNLAIDSYRIAATVDTVITLIFITIICVSTFNYPIHLHRNKERLRSLKRMHNGINIQNRMSRAGSDSGRIFIRSPQMFATESNNNNTMRGFPTSSSSGGGNNSTSTSNGKPKLKSRNSGHSLQNNLYSLENVIANETGFRLFMEHLASEFSTGK